MDNALLSSRVAVLVSTPYAFEYNIKPPVKGAEEYVPPKDTVQQSLLTKVEESAAAAAKVSCLLALNSLFALN